MMVIEQLISAIKTEGLLRAGDKLEILYKEAIKLEAENARLRQQRDAANALISVLMDEDAKTEW